MTNPDLLARRPDVLASRLRVDSAQAGLKAAWADFYPNIDLSAFAGTQAIGLDNLFHGAAGAFGVGPALHLPVFDAGRLRAKYRANTADIDIALTVYNQSVLSAVRALLRRHDHLLQGGGAGVYRLSDRHIDPCRCSE